MIYQEVEHGVMEILQESFFLAETYGFFKNQVTKLVNRFQPLDPCKPGNPNCTVDNWTKAYEHVVFPFLYYQHKFSDRMGLGTLVSHFQQELASDFAQSGKM